jgi:hypothetical protein
MISMAVLAFVLLAFMSIMWSATELSASSKEQSIGTFELQNAVEDIYSNPYGSFLSLYSPPGTNYPALAPFTYTFAPNPSTGKYAALPNEAITFTWTNWDRSNKIPHWVEFQVTITWTDHRGRTVTDSLVTRRAQ